MERECPYPDCGRKISPVMYACKKHWFLLPNSLRSAISQAWNCGDWAGHRAAKEQAQRFYDQHRGLTGGQTQA